MRTGALSLGAGVGDGAFGQGSAGGCSATRGSWRGSATEDAAETSWPESPAGTFLDVEKKHDPVVELNMF